MSHADEFWVAHDAQRERINRYVTVALDGNIDELLATVYADLEQLQPADQAKLVVGLVGAICSVIEQAADASGAPTDDYWRSHLLDIAEMTVRRQQNDEGQ